MKKKMLYIYISFFVVLAVFILIIRNKMIQKQNAKTVAALTNPTGVGGDGTRGKRNNNPLNIRISSDAWQGKIGNDGAFEKFSSMTYGLRAGIIILRTYYNKYGLKTIREMITRFAPPSENNTNSYVNNVSSRTGIDADKTLTFNKATMLPIIVQMCRIECGYIPSNVELDAAFSLANVN